LLLRRTAVFLLFACLALPALPEPLRLTSSAQAPYFLLDGQGFLDRLIPEVFRRVGVEARAVQDDAAARAKINANSGIDDGVAMRSRAIGSDFPNLLLVDEKVIDTEFVVFTLRRDLKITGFASLQPLHVGLITGWKVVEDGLLPDTSVTRAGNAEQLFNLLRSGHVDVVIFERWMGQYLLAQRKLPPLLATALYIQLHNEARRFGRAGGARCRRSGQSRPERVSRQYVARTAHAAQCHPRFRAVDATR